MHSRSPRTEEPSFPATTPTASPLGNWTPLRQPAGPARRSPATPASPRPKRSCPAPPTPASARPAEATRQLVIQLEDEPPLDPVLGKVCDAVVGPGRAEPVTAMGPPVVVGGVLVQDGPVQRKW